MNHLKSVIITTVEIKVNAKYEQYIFAIQLNTPLFILVSKDLLTRGARGIYTFDLL